MLWMIRNVPEVEKAFAEDRLHFGTIDSWLLHKLCGVQETDITNASRTLLMDVKTGQWSEEMLTIFGLKKSCLPTIRPCVHRFGTMNESQAKDIPVLSVLGDQQAATLGQFCLNVGDAKCTYGTGAFLLMNTGTTPVFSSNGMLTTPAFQLGIDEPVIQALEGAVAIAGKAIQWLRDGLHLIKEAHEINELASQVDSAEGLVFVPAFNGLFAP